METYNHANWELTVPTVRNNLPIIRDNLPTLRFCKGAQLFENTENLVIKWQLLNEVSMHHQR